jgi:SAM-dependent methyltransferase
MNAKADDKVETSRWQTNWSDGYIRVSKRGATSAYVTAERFIKSGGIRPQSKLLDMGCGHGRITELIAGGVQDLDIVGIDLTEEFFPDFLLKNGHNGCQLQLKRVDIDAEGLPFPDESFDVALSSRVWQYLSHPQTAVNEAFRVVKPGGVVVISMPNRLNPVKVLTYKRAKLYTPGEAKVWFENAGFKGVEATSMCFFPSTRKWHGLAGAVEGLGRWPLVHNFGGNVLVSGIKPTR